MKYGAGLKKLKHVKNQLLAKAQDANETDQKAYQGWAAECKESLDKADDHETRMEVLLAKVGGTEPVGKDPVVYERLLAETTAGFTTNEHMLEGLGMALSHCKNFLA